MLSNLNATDWNKIGIETFRPFDFEQPGPDPEPWQNYEPGGDPDAFLPDPFNPISAAWGRPI
jgi:hypothetical protein